MSDPRPIGLLDSGVGGLSVLREVRRELPAETLIYIADQAHLPYGIRPLAEIRALVAPLAERLIVHCDCKLLIVACNAANTAALHSLRAMYPETPIVGMEVAVKPAAEQTQTGVIGVITTQATAEGELLSAVVDRFARHVQVLVAACPEFVTLAEDGAPDTPASRALIERTLAPLKAAGIDQLVMGCTHFPFLMPLLRTSLGESVRIVDPAPAVARQTQRVLASLERLCDSDTPGRTHYSTTGDPTRFAALITTLIGEPHPIVQATQTLSLSPYGSPISSPSNSG
ncbi:MAG TPA: glutamate racemase [Aggregatilineales bacterium]|nr:glutamate racemase [Anaerolineales bacterium]HRE47492.1 glutamate racemase [Aggregatilineales bacterium]